MGKGGSKESKKQKQQQKACLAITVLLVAILIVLVVLYFTVFQPKDPKVHVPMMQLVSLDSTGKLYPPSSSTSVNLTIHLQVSIYNPNKASFIVQGGVSCLYFCDTQVGFTNLPPGIIPEESTASVTSPLTVEGSPLQGPNLVNDLLNDSTLDISTSVTVIGRVTTLNLFTHHARVITKCFVRISPNSKTILAYTCHPSYSLDQ